MRFRPHVTVLAWLLALAATAHGQIVPVPRQKPARAETVTALPVPHPRPNPRRADLPDEQPSPPAKTGGSCRQRLAGLDIAFKPLPPVTAAGGCGTAEPILLSNIAGVDFTPPATITCEMAESLHGWVTGSVQPAAKKRLKTRVTEVHVAASYVCRLRNNQSSGKLSEHAKANALDMSGFSFAKSDAVAVQSGWGGVLAAIGLSKSGSFLNDIHSDACKYFTTVLGPGSDRYHGDHFHVDVLQRRNGYRICQ